jgi:hypothetical protein
MARVAAALVLLAQPAELPGLLLAAREQLRQLPAHQ